MTSAEPPPSPPPGVSVPSLKSLRTHVGRSTVRLRSRQTYTTSNATAADRPFTGTGRHNAHAWLPRELVSIRAAPTASFTSCTGHNPHFSGKLYSVSHVIITFFTNYVVTKRSSPSWPTTATQCRYNSGSVGRWPAFTARRWRSRRPTAAVCVAADQTTAVRLAAAVWRRFHRTSRRVSLLMPPVYDGVKYIIGRTREPPRPSRFPIGSVPRTRFYFFYEFFSTRPSYLSRFRRHRYYLLLLLLIFPTATSSGDRRLRVAAAAATAVAAAAATAQHAWRVT